ncbi:unnamed protein product [Alopecurus aequalis]
MPRRTEDAAFAKQVEPEECLEFDDHEEEIEEEEIEYEEIEEEVEEEVEEDDDILEEVEESEEEEEEDPEEREDIHEVDGCSKLEGVSQQDDTKDGKDKEKHAELLARPPHGSEVYVGTISGDASSEDLKKLCEPVGEVVEVRVMPGKKDNRGYAFVTFRTNDLALKAIEKLNNATFKGKKIRVSSSQANNKLFVGNVPHSWAHGDLKKAVEEVGPGVLKVDLIKDTRTDRNRGYGFVEYYNNACAEYSRQKMSTPNFKLGTNTPNVSWADVKNGDSASAGSTSQVKSVYVKNLPKNVTLEQLKSLFERHGEITKVVIPPSKNGHDKRYGFVHFKDRHMAMKAVKNTEKYELDGHLLDCSLAKPPADKKAETVSVSSTKGGPLLHAPLGYGIMPRPDAYAAPPAYGAPPTYGAQPLLYAPGAPPGAAMVPMLLPDGRLVYVVQQPAMQQHYASPPPQSRQHQHQHQHFSSPSSQGRQSGRHGGSGGGGGSGGSSRSGSGAKRSRGDDNNSNSRNKGRQRR